MTELEDRLHADLPRLAELIAHGPDEDVPTVVSRRDRSRGRRRAIATAVAMCVLLGGVTVVVARSVTHEPAFSPRVGSSDVWRSLPPSPLGPRANVVTVWTGNDVLVWGGYRGNPTDFTLQSGAVYDPTTDSWRKIADKQSAHPGAVGVWAKDRLYVLAKNGGAQYDPRANAWHDIARLPGGMGGGFHAAAWTGTTLFGVLAEREAGTIAVALRQPARYLDHRKVAARVAPGCAERVHGVDRQGASRLTRHSFNMGLHTHNEHWHTRRESHAERHLNLDHLDRTHPRRRLHRGTRPPRCACGREHVAYDRRFTAHADRTTDRNRRRRQSRRVRSIRP